MMYNMVVLNSFVMHFVFMWEEFLTRRREKNQTCIGFSSRLRGFA